MLYKVQKINFQYMFTAEMDAACFVEKGYAEKCVLSFLPSTGKF